MTSIDFQGQLKAWLMICTSISCSNCQTFDGQGFSNSMTAKPELYWLIQITDNYSACINSSHRVRSVIDALCVGMKLTRGKRGLHPRLGL